MELKSTIQAIAKGLEEVQQILVNLEKTGETPSIEIDLAMEKLRNVYDVLHLIKNAEHTQTQILSEKEPPKEDAIEQPDFEIEESPTQEDDDKIKDRASEPAAEETSKSTLSDRFKDTRSSLNENLAQANIRKDVSSKLQSKPVDDIRRAIGLNERFSFIKNLFHGDNKLYDDTMVILNNTASFNDAFNYLMENFDWKMDDPIVLELLEIIRRKHIISKNE